MSSIVPHPTVEGAAKAHGGQTSQGENPWLAYFGPSNGPIITNAYDKYAEQNYDLPEAYKGKNLYLQETITGLVTDAQKPDFYTTVLLPWQQTDQINFAWNEFHFNETLAGRVPHEGISRLVTSSKRARTDKSVRRGIAMVLEHGFMSTAEGQEHYRRNLLGIAQCVQETANHDVMAALFSCDNYDREWERNHGVLTDGVRRAVNEEVYAYARLQKQPNGLDIAIEDAKQRMKRYGVIPDTLVIPPKVAIYLTMVRPEKTQYWVAGPNGAKSLRQGPDAMTNFRGLNVFETRSFDVYAGETPVDLGLRRRQVGEYYPVQDNSTVSSIREHGYDADNMSVIIYDESVDNWRKITVLEMLKHCGRYNRSGKFHFDGRVQADDSLTFDNPASPWKALHDHAIKHGYTSSVFAVDKSTPPTSDMDHFRFTYYESDGEFPPDPFYSNHEFDKKSRKHGFFASTTINAFHNTICGQNYIPRLAQAILKSNVGGGGGKFLEQWKGKQLNESVMPTASPTALIQKLFAGHNQKIELQQLFLGAPIEDAQAAPNADELLMADENGYTGYPALHCSFRGLQLIAEHGDMQDAVLAKNILQQISKIQQQYSFALPGLAQHAHHLLPAHYMRNVDGTPSARNARFLTSAIIFQLLANTACGHSLAPVTVEGTIDSNFLQMPADTITCPAFAIAHFTSSRGGVLGGLGICNSSINAQIGQVPVDEIMHADCWMCGAPGTYNCKSYIGARAPAHKVGTSASKKRGRDDSQASVASAHNSFVGALVGDLSDVREDRFDKKFDSGLFPSSFNKRYPLFQKDGQDVELAQFPHTDTMFDFTQRLLLEMVKFEAPPLMQTAAFIVSYTAIDNLESLQQFVSSGFPLPFSFLLARPFIEHQMQTLICMKSGGDTGHSYYGHNSVTIGDDAISKMHYVNLTFYSKAVIREHKNVIRLEDAYAAGYVGGNDCEFFANGDEVSRHDATAPDSTPKSLLAMVIGCEEATRLPNPLDLTGEFGNVLDRDQHYKMRYKNKNMVHYSSAPFYSRYFNFNEIAKGSQQRQYAIPRFTTDLRPANTMCFQGAQWNYNAATQKHDIEVSNSGHWGPTFPGVRAVREGQQKYVESGNAARLPVPSQSALAPVY